MTLTWLYRQRCRWLDRHEDIFYTVGHNVGKECRYCGRHGYLTAADIAAMRRELRFLGGEDDEVAMEASDATVDLDPADGAETNDAEPAGKRPKSFPGS